MDNVKEKLTVVTTVEEDEEQNNEELFFSLNTLQSNSATHITDNLLGEFDSIIIQTNKPVRVLINLVEYPDIVLYDVISLVGTQYLPIRISPVNKDGEQFNYAPQKYKLNNRLQFTIEGAMETEVSFNVRLD